MENKKRALLYLCLIVFTIANSGCFTAYQAFNTGNRSPVYLHLPNPDAYTYYVDGQKTTWTYVPYSTSKVSETATTITTQTTSLPALSVKADRAYTTLRIVDASGASRNYILKSGLMQGAKFILYFQGMFTLGAGNVIDFSTKSVYAWPELAVQ